MALTKQQRACLAVLDNAIGPLSVTDLAEAIGAPPEGAAATASSLVRRRLVERTRAGGHVFYAMRTER